MENKFEYTYSAPRNAEIEKIRKKYVPQTSTESKLEQIKKLDSSVESEAVGCALGIGIPGSLVWIVNPKLYKNYLAKERALNSTGVK